MRESREIAADSQPLRDTMMFVLRVLQCCAVLGAAMPVVAATAQSPAALLQHAVRELKAEARAVRETGEVQRRSADYAKAFLREHNEVIPGEIVWNVFRRPADRDPFVDAYVRWQLTGFDPQIPDQDALKPEQFAAFLDALPEFIANPRSDRALIGSVNGAIAAEQLSEADITTISALDEQLRREEGSANALNRPASLLRDWIEEQFGDHDHRVHQVRLERIASRATAGWNVEREKQAFASGLEQAADDPLFTAPLRERLALAATRLAGLRTPILTRVTVVEGAAQAQFDEAAVYDFEVTAWIRAMRGRAQMARGADA